MTARPLEQTAPFHLLARRTGNSTWWHSLTELAPFLVVFALLFVAVTEGLRAGLGARADDLLAFGSMGVALLALPLAVRWGERRPAVQLMGVVPCFDWPVFWRAASLTAGVMTLLILCVALLVGSRPPPSRPG